MITFSPQFADSKGIEQSERVQVELEVSELLHPKVKLRQQTWSEDLGWLTQKTLTLELEQAQSLLHDLEQSLKWGKAHRSQAQKQANQPLALEYSETEVESKIIPFRSRNN
jgi:hypothetical protein